MAKTRIRLSKERGQWTVTSNDRAADNVQALVARVNQAITDAKAATFEEAVAAIEAFKDGDASASLGGQRRHARVGGEAAEPPPPKRAKKHGTAAGRRSSSSGSRNASVAHDTDDESSGEAGAADGAAAGFTYSEANNSTVGMSGRTTGLIEDTDLVDARYIGDDGDGKDPAGVGYLAGERSSCAWQRGMSPSGQVCPIRAAIV